VVNCAASSIEQPVCHGTVFHDINFYSRVKPQSQKNVSKELLKFEPFPPIENPQSLAMLPGLTKMK
jgi:hypothetical protein